MTSYCRFYAGVWFVVTYAGKVVAVGGRTYNPDAGRFSNLELE